MSNTSLRHEDVLEIIKLVEMGDAFTDFKLRYEGFEIEISKGGGRAVAQAPAPAAAPVVVSHPVPVALAAPANAAPLTPSAATIGDGMVVVKAPMVGTFYRASEPGAEPFVKVGSRVQANDTVCIIEVMKLMNALGAEAAGVVVDVLVADGQTVEYGQPLIVIDPTQ